MTHRSTGLGSMPGDDIAEAVRVVLGEAGDLPFLPELPARGAPAGMVGRTLGLVVDLGADLQPAGWRLTPAPGIDHRRARSLLHQDLDRLEELSGGHLATVKVQVTGPWTLAAMVEKPRGDKVLADSGARRDLGQALAAAVTGHVADVRRRLSATEVVVQIDEPLLPAVLAGSVPTASGFSRHRSVTAPEAAQRLAELVRAATPGSPDDPPEPASSVVLHCCAPSLPWKVLRESGIQMVSLDATALRHDDLEDVSDWLDAGRTVWPGVVPTVEPARPMTGADLTRVLLRWWADVGHTEVESIPATTVTPTCGLGGASPVWARTALELAAAVSRNLSVEQGRIET